MDHENLYDQTALQAVHLTRNKSRDSFIQRDNVVTVCQSICKSLHSKLYYGSWQHTKAEIVHSRYGLFFQCSFIFIQGEKKGMSVTVAIDHENLYDHTALQATHLNKYKSRDSFIQRDNVVTVCQSICKSFYPKLYYVSCTFTKFDWIT